MKYFGAFCGVVFFGLGAFMTALAFGAFGDPGDGASWYATVGPATAGLGVALAWVSLVRRD